jgi:hypothetical protein
VTDTAINNHTQRRTPSSRKAKEHFPTSHYIVLASPDLSSLSDCILHSF